jgi:hypothetical protein
MSRAVDAVVEALAPLSTDSERMRVLAAVSCLCGRDDDAEWFLDAARNAGRSSPRCGRCGHVWGKTRTG